MTHPLTIGLCDGFDMGGKKKTETRVIPVSLALLSRWLEMSCIEIGNSEI